jgi:TonB family protein
MKVTKEQIIGFSGAVILCLLIVLLLSFIFLQTEIKAQEEGVFVNFGTVDWAAGTVEPAPSGGNQTVPVEDPVPEVIPVPEPAPARPSPQPPVITQTHESTAAIEAAKEKKLEQERQEAERRRLAEEQRKKVEEEQRKKEAINRQMSDAFGTGNTSGNEGAAASGTGNQGSTQGNAATGAYTGTGGVGSFDLSGRSLRGGGLQRPSYDIQEEGSIVVEITVDPQGNVITADVRLRGTNIENSNMRRSAIEAAKKTKFNAIAGSQNQIGSITYKYTLK